jgi:putative phosphonate metabolism protein
MGGPGLGPWQRYAVYAAPDGALAEAAHAWLGWDAYGGQPRPHPDLPGLPRPLAEITEAPRKYGFHGTLKAPFRLAAGADEAAFLWAVEALAQRLVPARAAGLRLAGIEGFVALLPEGAAPEVEALASAVVAGLDAFRAPQTAADLARRSAARLTARQRVLLDRWGYPYVMEEFRFHLTLTGVLPEAERGAVERVLAAWLPPLPRPFVIDALAVHGEAADGRFHRIGRYSLSG